jgi:hypothetical protein
MKAGSPRHGNSRRACCVATVLLAACATTPRGAAGAGEGRWGERVLVEAQTIPAAWLQRDRDGGAPEPERDEALGYGLRAAIGNQDQSIGLLTQVLHGRSGSDLDAGTLGLDFDVRKQLDRDWPDWLFVRGGATVGLGWIDAGDGATGTEAVGQLRLGVDFQVTRTLLFQCSFGGIVFGTPGETEVYGTLVTVGGGLTF